MRVVVTGGSGLLGSEVVACVRDLGHTAIPASRRWGIDLTTGQGLNAALTGASAVIHCASNPRRAKRTDVEGTAGLLAAIASMPKPAHLVHVSIVGCDANPNFYYQAKARAEDLVLSSGLPATIVRATQFHQLVLTLAKMLTVGRTRIDLDMAAQPVDPAWFARQLVDHALGSPPDGPTRARDIAGPELVTAREAAETLRANGETGFARAIKVPVLGGTLRSFAGRTNLPGPDTRIGGQGFHDWVREHAPQAA